MNDQELAGLPAEVQLADANARKLARTLPPDQRAVFEALIDGILDLTRQKLNLMSENAELRDEIGTKVPAIMWQHAEAELATARETIKRLNRRVQVAEAGVAEKVKASAQGSFGRALANAASEMFMHERDEARADLAALKRRIEEAPVYKCDADVISGRDYDYISAVLIHDDPGFQYPDVDGKRVALLPVGGE